MAGSQTLRLRGGGFVAALAVALLTFAGLARAQYPSPPAATPARSFADLVESDDPPLAMPAPTTVPRPSYYPGEVPAGTRVETGLLRHDQRVDLRQARSEHLAAAPALDALQRGLERGLGAVAQRLGRRPRQGWINAADGNLYRLSFFTFAQGFNRGPEGRRLPRRLHDLHAAEPPPGPDHQRPLRAPQQRRHRPAHHRPEPAGRRRRRRATRGSATSRSRPASCCTRRRTSRSRASSRS